MRDGALTSLTSLRDELWNFRRATRDGVWKEVLKYTEPAFSDFDNREATQVVVNPHVFNSTPATSAWTASSGTAGYACSPSIDWFNYVPEIPDDARMGENMKRVVRGQLQRCTKIDRQGFAKSGFYDQFEACMKLFYEIGTAVLMQEWDDATENVVYTLLHPGDFVMMQDRKHKVDTVIWRERMTRSEIVAQWPKLKENFAKDDGQEQKYHWVYHYVGSQKRLRLGVAGGAQDWESVTWFAGDGETEADDRNVVEAKGVDEFPFAILRYDIDPGGNPYAETSPGIVSLYDNKNLQVLTESYQKAVVLASQPPIKATEGLPLNIGPFGVTRLSQGADYAFLPTGADIGSMAQQIAMLENKIQQAYHVNFFLALMSSIEKTKTATEAEGLQNEQSAMLSSMFDKIDGFLESVVEFRYRHMLENGLYGDLDVERAEMPKVDFTSPMRVSQERTHRWVPLTTKVSFFAQLAQMVGDPTVLTDNINLAKVGPLFDEVFDTPAEVSRSEEEVAEIRSARAEAQARQQAVENSQSQQMADAKTMMARNQAPQPGSPNAGPATGMMI